MLELKRGDRALVQTEMVEVIAFCSHPQKNLIFGYFTSWLWRGNGKEMYKKE